MKKSYKPYSYSKLAVYNTCPKKFKYKYILKLKEEIKDKTPLVKGKLVHKALEVYPEKIELGEYNTILENFLNSRYSELLKIPRKAEIGIGLTEDLEPVDYSKNILFRGYIDYMSVINELEEVIMNVDSLDDIPGGYELIEIIEE